MKMRKKLTDYILIGLLIINLIMLFIFRLNDTFKDIQMIHLYILFIIIFLVIPLHDYIKRGSLKNKLVVLLFIVRFGVGIIFSATSYQIFFTNNYNLKYTYWMWIICFIFAILISYFESLINDYQKRKSLEKRFNKLYIGGRILLIILLMCLPGETIGKEFIQSQKQLILNDIKIPESISIYKYDITKHDVNSYINSSIAINNPNDLRKITKELESARIVNITSTDLLNYERMREDNQCYYNLIFNYGDSKDEKIDLKNGYIYCLQVTANGNVVIKNINSYDRIIFGEQYYQETYPITLSKEIVNLIFVYINKISN